MTRKENISVFNSTVRSRHAIVSVDATIEVDSSRHYPSQLEEVQEVLDWDLFMALNDLRKGKNITSFINDVNPYDEFIGACTIALPEAEVHILFSVKPINVPETKSPILKYARKFIQESVDTVAKTTQAHLTQLFTEEETYLNELFEQAQVEVCTPA